MFAVALDNSANNVFVALFRFPGSHEHWRGNLSPPRIDFVIADALHDLSICVNFSSAAFTCASGRECRSTYDQLSLLTLPVPYAGRPARPPITQIWTQSSKGACP